MSAYNLHYFGKAQHSAAHDEQLAKARIARWSKGRDPSQSNKENTSPPPDTHRLPPTHRYHLRQEARVRAPSVASEAAAVSMAAEVTPTTDKVATQSKSQPGPLKRYAVDEGRLSTEIKKQRRQIDTLRKEKDSLRKKAVRQRTKIKRLETTVAEVRVQFKSEKRVYRQGLAEASREKASLRLRAQRAEARVEIQKADLDALRAKLRAITIADARREAVEEKRLEAELEAFAHVCLKDHGRWSEEARRAVRRLYNIGCSLQSISKAFVTVCDVVHINIEGVPSVQACTYIIVEGGVLAELHIVDELLRADGELALKPSLIELLT